MTQTDPPAAFPVYAEDFTKPDGRALTLYGLGAD